MKVYVCFQTMYGDDDLSQSSTPSSSSRSKSSTPTPSPTPIARPRPSTPAGSSIYSTDSDSVLPYPVAPPRLKKREVEPLGHRPLIKLDSLEATEQITIASSKAAESTLVADNETQYRRLSSEFDPLENVIDKESSHSDVSISSSEFVQSDGQESLNNNEADPMKHRASVMRHNAFYKIQKPPSVKRRSPQPQATDANTIKEARTAFIELEVTKPSMTSELDIFDPLQTGQLAVDAKMPPSGLAGTMSNLTASTGHSPQKMKSPEENLLKEWNLDFGKMNVGGKTQRPPVAPKPSLSPGSRVPVAAVTTMGQLLGMAPPSGGMVMSAQPYMPQRQSMSHSYIQQGPQYYNPTITNRHSVAVNYTNQPFNQSQASFGAMTTGLKPMNNQPQTGFGAMVTAPTTMTKSANAKPNRPPVPRKPVSPYKAESPSTDLFGDLDPLQKKSASPVFPVSPQRSPPVSSPQVQQSPKQIWQTFE